MNNNPSDIIALLHRLQPNLMQNMQMNQGDPYAESLFQQGYGPQAVPDAPQMEQSAHPGWDAVMGSVGEAADESGFRPRNFWEGLATGAVKGATGAYNKRVTDREGRNAESKAAYKATLKASHDERMKAQENYASYSKSKALRVPRLTPEEIKKNAEAQGEGYQEGMIKAKKKNGVPLVNPGRPKPAPKPEKPAKFTLFTPAENAGIKAAEKARDKILANLRTSGGPYEFDHASALNDPAYVKAHERYEEARKRALLSSIDRAKGNIEMLKQIQLSIAPGDSILTRK